MISFSRSHKQQNGSKIIYYLELFCPLRKGILLLARERDTFWNPFLESVFKVDAKLTKLGYIYLDGEVTIIELDTEVNFKLALGTHGL
jgi:hypothetical protein